ncbi:MAG: hypothetical protein IV096_08865, partial [Microbacterium sp.]|nr:hypothetical protein [Microbacterium sp.]
MPRVFVPASALALVLMLAACGTTGTEDAEGAAAAFPSGTAVDYQLGEAYPPADGVGIVVRDRSADPAPGLYSICYVCQSVSAASRKDEEVLAGA